MKEKILKLRKEGKSIRQISKLVGLSRSAVWARLNPEKHLLSQKNRRIRRKQVWIKLRGSKCQICGYNKCLTALDFHHLDKNTKEFSIANGYRIRKKEDEIIKEIEKCVLLCSNCHHEVHENLVAIRGVEPRPKA